MAIMTKDMILLRVLTLLVVVNLDSTSAQNCRKTVPPTDANADLPEHKRTDRDDDDVITYTCSPGFTNGGSQSASNMYSLTCEGDSWLTADDARDKSCDDVNECLTVDCGSNAYCVNVPGTYVCVCDGSSAYDSMTGDCTSLLCGAPPVDACAKRSEAGRDPVDTAAYTCKEGYGKNGDPSDNTYNITCDGTTGHWSPITDYCEDVDECSGANGCDANADCTNVPGSYTCKCHQGYTGDGFSCSRVTCPVLPPDIPNGNVDASSNMYNRFGERVSYICNAGYEVKIMEGLDDTLSQLYGIDQTSFSAICTASGKWSIWPLPCCVPISCGDPGHVAHANRSAGEFSYNTYVTYICDEGFWIKDQVGTLHYFTIMCRGDGYWDPLQECVDSSCGDPGVVPHAIRSGKNFTFGSKFDYECLPGFASTLGPQGFSRTCGSDGYWSEGSTCEDVDECEEFPDICGERVNYCMNTIGSYMCSCVPWYLKDPSDTRCLGWAGLTEFDGFKPCDIVKTIGMCVHGDCKLKEGQAVCSCESGYTGHACDVETFGRSMVLSIIALVLACVFSVFTFVFWVCFIYAGLRNPTSPLNPAIPPMKFPMPLRRMPKFGGPFGPYSG